MRQKDIISIYAAFVVQKATQSHSEPVSSYPHGAAVGRDRTPPTRVRPCFHSLIPELGVSDAWWPLQLL